MRHRPVAPFAALLLLTSLARAGDWPLFPADANRSAYTPDALPRELALAWTYRPAHALAPAWPLLARMTFDTAHQVVVARGIAVFGSSVDGRVVALDAGTRPRWSTTTTRSG